MKTTMKMNRWHVKAVRENHTPIDTDETTVVTLPKQEMNHLLVQLFKKGIVKSAFDSTSWGKRFKQIYLSPSQSVAVPSLYRALLEWKRRQRLLEDRVNAD